MPSCPLRYAVRVEKGREMETPNGPLGGETIVVEADVALEAHGPLVALDAASLRMAQKEKRADGTRAPRQELEELPEILLDNHATWLESTGEEPFPLWTLGARSLNLALAWPDLPPSWRPGAAALGGRRRAGR